MPQPFGFMANLVARQLERRMAEALRPLNLTPAYLPVIFALAESEPKTQTELAVALDIRQPTMAQTLGRMERDGLISRTPHPQDRRATAITLTAKARNHLDRIYSLAAQIGADAMENIPAERRRQLMSDLETISAGLGTPTDTTDTTQPRP